MRLSKLAGLLGIILLAACATEYPQSSIAPTSDFADRIQTLYVQIFIWTMGILAVVWAVLAYILIRFRERPDSPEPEQIHGHTGLEIAWTIVPALIVVAITVPTIQAVFDTQTPPENAMVVDVIGHQYWWEFRYPQEEGGIITANELRLPVDQPIALRIWSTDVIHSFWVPQLGGKRDANPLRQVPEGEELRYNWIYLTPQETGEFMGQCAEFCGESHSLMGMRVVVETRAEFDSWLDDWRTGHSEVVTQQAALREVPDASADRFSDEEQVAAIGQDAAAAQTSPQQALINEGREIFSGAAGCIVCHAITGNAAANGRVGPDLTLIGRRSRIAAGWLENTPENLARWITDPASVKPGALMPGVDYAAGRPVWPATNLTPEQVRAVAAYLTSLR